MARGESVRRKKNSSSCARRIRRRMLSLELTATEVRFVRFVRAELAVEPDGMDRARRPSAHPRAGANFQPRLAVWNSGNNQLTPVRAESSKKGGRSVATIDQPS